MFGSGVESASVPHPGVDPQETERQVCILVGASACSSLLSLCFSLFVLPTPDALSQSPSRSATKVLLPPHKLKKKEKKRKKKNRLCNKIFCRGGQRSYFLISHLQELGVHISGTLPFLVEQELVIAAISTNGCMLEGEKEEPNTVSKLRPHTENLTSYVMVHTV